MPTTVEWTRFKRYARRMRELGLDLSDEPIPLDVLSVLQLRALNEPLLPNLKTVQFKKATADIIPFIPLFLPHRTTDIDIYSNTTPPAVMVASMVINLPKLCPQMQSISLQPLPIDSTITSATSEMLLTCNLNTLQFFLVDSSLTEEGRQVVFRLPNLRGLWSVLTEPTSLPAVSLPNLVHLDIEYHHDHDWLRAFHGTTLSKLEEVTFHAKHNQIGDFLEAFEDVALATSAYATISRFRFCTSHSWNPSYYSLLSFKQLKELVVEFSCENGCSSKVDDEIITALAQAMPKLEILQIGGPPCQAPSDVTIQRLIALAHHCLGLSMLRIHFQTDSLVVALINEAIPSPSSGESRLPREDCALASLEVGEIPVPEQHMLPIVLTLLRVFPRLRNIEYIDEGWEEVENTIRLSSQIGSLVQHSLCALHAGNPLEDERADSDL
ncbi:hypothetical protein BDM02DRAFT_3124263 [Thelephora ganbajun]|uniref:Uncharacterized protein n=1 Tax=Thelephora ganbajun TaxID=370292 RepID=A0ACB6YZF7_THEGA|nr:hypothetical protein BDM02DRAFT_3124263 [Thelephora ganbajun]